MTVMLRYMLRSSLHINSFRTVQNFTFCRRNLRTMKAKKWIVGSLFSGEPNESNLKLVEEELPELNDGEILIEALCWSVDPYMRPSANYLGVGDTMVGQYHGKVIESKHPKYPVGMSLNANLGWRTHSVVKPDELKPSNYNGSMVPVLTTSAAHGNEPNTTVLGVLGMPGATAYLGVSEILNPKPGETLLVNGAAGAVGSLVGQIGKIKGCNVIGFAGTDDKVRYLKEELGFDHAFNYKTDDIDKSLKTAAPNGVDCYFDNVGGVFTTKVIFGHMNTFGRIAICGVISSYNDDMMKPRMAPELYGLALFKQLRIQGFIVYNWFDKFNTAWVDILKWIQEGKLKYQEHRTEGFDNMRAAFYGLLKGENTGKAVIVPDSSKL